MRTPSSESKPRTLNSDLKAVGHWVDRHARYFLAASVVGFVLSAVLHFSTFFVTPADEAWELSSLLLVASLPVCAGALAVLIRRNRYLSLKEYLWDRRKEASRSNRRFWSGIHRNIPTRSGAAICLLTFYLLISLLLSVLSIGKENARIVEGRYVLVHRSGAIREVHRDVWNSKFAQEFRLVSGQPMLFYALCIVYFYHRPEDKYYREYLQWRKKRGASGRTERSAQEP